MTLRDAVQVAAAGGRLSPAERRVVEAVIADSDRVAFGTVAELASRSGTSGPTVVRVARKLGYDGYRGLQAAAQLELTDGLAPASQRIRRTAGTRDDPLGRALAVELANVEGTLHACDPTQFDAAVRVLADRKRRILVVAGDAERGIATAAADQLGQLRDGVELLTGTAPRVASRVALAGRHEVALAIDVRRYDRWVLDAVTGLRAAGATLVAVTDGPLSPLVPGATAWFAVRAEGPGPFDSHVGTLALLHALVTGVADRLRGSATARLDRIEQAWIDRGVVWSGSASEPAPAPTGTPGPG
jgi:DNA-binding MurR/RpiR family transcriptional regulator